MLELQHCDDRDFLAPALSFCIHQRTCTSDLPEKFLPRSCPSRYASESESHITRGSSCYRPSANSSSLRSLSVVTCCHAASTPSP